MSRLAFSVARPARVGVLISGRGSNMVALVEAADAPNAPFQTALVVSNAPDAPGLDAAQRLGVSAACVDHRAFPKDKPAFEAALTAALVAAEVDVVCLAGFMRILSPSFLNGRWRDRVLNIHPSLLPAFTGLGTHQRALDAGVRLHGATVHLARPTVDDGPILAQAAVPVKPGDTETALAARVLEAEHLLYPHALALFVTGAVSVDAGGARIVDHRPTPEAPALFSPNLGP